MRQQPCPISLPRENCGASEAELARWRPSFPGLGLGVPLTAEADAMSSSTRTINMQKECVTIDDHREPRLRLRTGEQSM